VKTRDQQQSVFTCGNLGNLWFLRGHQSILQNKANFRNDKTNATSCAAKDYENKPPLGDSKKQTQSNPIPRRADRGHWLGLPAL